MKNFLVLLFIIFVQHQGFAWQISSDEFKYKAVYQLTYQPDSTDVGSVTTEEMWLYLGEEISQFSSKGTALNDSLNRNSKISGAAMPDFQARLELTRTEFDYILYKNVPEGKISYTLQILGDKLRYEENKNNFEWEILPETRTIQGYESQKARTTFRGREYTAWFTSEIPIPEGPYKFNGLPGLILQLEDDRNHYVFELVRFENLINRVPFTLAPENFSLTTKEKLLQLKRQYEEDPFSALENRNQGSARKVTIKMSKQDKRKQLKKFREELEKKNNPIELQ